jgi:hypothetical protein
MPLRPSSIAMLTLKDEHTHLFSASHLQPLLVELPMEKART